ncbi:MAG TPA: DNA polymerase IV [Gammaproteobacteria bacterium]|nr:DNA polymerase IV [Gammaproteobacteria bacterium]
MPHAAFTPWKRAIILVDMNAFFASIEQLDHPEWRGRPVAITNGLTGTCIITCSYEARAHGIHTGMRLKQARRLCPGLIQSPARPGRYAAVSARIMAALETITPDVEVFSVDEAFLDVTRCQRLLGPPEHIARLTKQTVFQASGVLCSVGVSGDKTTAKYAAKLDKPDGLTVIPPWEARARLRDVPVTELCGINKGIGRFLAERGVHTCGDMARLPIGVLARRFGNPGRRIWYMAQGADPEPLQLTVAAPKSIGHGKVMPPNTRDRGVIHTYLLHMSEKVAARLRRHNMVAQHFAIGLKTHEGWIGNKARTILPTQDGRRILRLSKEVIHACWRGQGVHQVQVTALDPRPGTGQLELFDDTADNSHDSIRKANAAMDQINARYGEFTLAPARLLNRSTMPNVIAPAWKPYGHRQTIQDREADARTAATDAADE